MTGGRDERERLDEAKRLESLGALAGGVAHEFNNLLVAILGNTDLALRDLPEGSPVRRYLKQVETASRQAADLAQQLLAFAGRGAVAARPIELGALAAATRPILALAVSHKTKVEIEATPGTPLVEADASQMRQALLGFVTNAGEAMPDGGTVTVTVGAGQADRAELAAAIGGEELPEGEYVRVEVADDGAGIAPAVRGRIFEPFFSTKKGSRGLGLPAILGIVRAHGGALAVESEPGRGSRFRMLLPSVRSRSPRAAGVRGGAVLVVDDEEIIRRMACEMLEALGYRTLVAPDGPEALRVLEEKDDVRTLLLDQRMPGVRGEDVAREARRLRPEVRVVFMSGYDDERPADAAAPFLRKPFHVADLQRALEQ